MDHPNIARVLDAGTTEAGRPYFVMDLVKGVPITDYCDQEQADAHKSDWSCLLVSVTQCNTLIKRALFIVTLNPPTSMVTLHDGKARSQGD